MEVRAVLRVTEVTGVGKTAWGAVMCTGKRRGSGQISEKYQHLGVGQSKKSIKKLQRRA